ncbi:MAG: DUF2058 domain-containing protein [Gammaproteobacteria bacterium]|nr:DUF2058 domain-containing protein [Gammaproteobacteria bacterium]
MSSLQEQLLKAGLTTKDKLNKVKGAKHKQEKIKRAQKREIVDNAKLEAQKTQKEMAERARKLNQLKNAEAQEKAIVAQIKQIIDVNKQSGGKPEVTFNFSDNGKIKKLEISKEIHRYLTKGFLAISRYNGEYAIIPKNIAAKIEQRSKDYIVLLNQEEAQSELEQNDDPYADYQIPDDLMW